MIRQYLAIQILKHLYNVPVATVLATANTWVMNTRLDR